MSVRNKWNGRYYQMLSIVQGKVTLKRDDGTQFVISEKEFNINYREVANETN